MKDNLESLQPGKMLTSFASVNYAGHLNTSSDLKKILKIIILQCVCIVSKNMLKCSTVRKFPDIKLSLSSQFLTIYSCLLLASRDNTKFTVYNVSTNFLG